MTRTGKIAKLPNEIREELNHQLERGVPGRVLVAWLNAHPAVQAVLREFFAGAPVKEQNLSAWRLGGFADWKTRREFFDQVREVAADAGEFEEAAARMAGHAARLLSAHYAIALSELPLPRAAVSGSPAASEPCPYAAFSARLKPLAAVTRTVVALRREEHESARLKMEQQAFALACPAHAASARPAKLRPPAACPKRGNQRSLSQIKVPEFPEKPPRPASTQKPAPPCPPDAPDIPSPASPPHLTLTFPPDLHFFASPSVHSQVA